VCIMRQGRYFRIPENAADVEHLWCTAEKLSRSSLPHWLTAEDADGYRFLGPTSISTSPTGEQDHWHSETNALEAAGFVVDQDPGQPSIYRLYLPMPNEDVWSIGIYTGQSPFGLSAASRLNNPVLTREQITDVQASFVADPFMIRADDGWYMFFEVMNWRTGKGEIGLALSKDGLAWKYQEIVMTEPFHLSYPYVFSWRGEYYMIPESYQAGAIRLYKARNFPTQWSFVAPLLDGPYLVDASIFRYDDKWWLYAETNPEVKHDCLRLYFANELTGPWVEHPRSPIVSHDAKVARPAGRVLVFGTEIFRFTQDCSLAYGSAVHAFKVSELDTRHYMEAQVGSAPILAASGSGWNADGMHHLDAHRMLDGRWIACVDGWRRPQL
jgi:hypothetical protein